MITKTQREFLDIQLWPCFLKLMIVIGFIFEYSCLCLNNISEFLKCARKKLVEILEEAKRVGRAEPRNSYYHVSRMERMDKFNRMEEKL